MKNILILIVAVSMVCAGAIRVSAQTADIEYPVEDFIGVWKKETSGSLFVIVPQEPDIGVSAYRLEAHTGKRVWQGWYTPFPEGDINRLQDSRVLLKYKPAADEMNPEIPRWAREKLEGQLTWEIELDKPEACTQTPRLTGKFYPGHVEWSGENKVTRISGRGEPRDMSLLLQALEPEGVYVRSSIRIRPPVEVDEEGGLNGPLPPPPIQALVEKQLFHVEVSLPYELADQQGEELTVTIRGLGSGESASVDLSRAAHRTGRPTKYAHFRPLFFGEGKPFLSQSWLDEVGRHEQLVDIDLSNGESVAVGFDDTFEVFPVYKDLEELSIARYMLAVGFLEKVHRERMGAPGVSEAVKEDAHIRLLRIKNFKAIMSNDQHPKWLKVMIAEEYLGPVREVSQLPHNPKHIYGAGQIRISNIHLPPVEDYTGSELAFASNELTAEERLGDNDEEGRFNGVIWSNNYERLNVTRLIRKEWRKKARQAFDQLMVDITYALYEWVLSEASVGTGRFNIGVADLFALSGDEDHYGRKLPKGKKIEIISNVLLSNLTDYSTDKMRDGVFDESFGYQAPSGKFLTVEDVARALRGRNVQTHYVRKSRPHRKENPDFPGTLNDSQKEIAAPALMPRPSASELSRSVSCAQRPPRADGSPTSDDMERALDVAARFGINADIDEHQPVARSPQQFGTCQAGAILAAADVDPGINEIAVLYSMAQNDAAFRDRLKGSDYTEHPLVKGYTEEDMHVLAGILGRESKELPSGKKMPINNLRMLKDNGWSIKMAIHARDADGNDDTNKHALNIVGFEHSNDCGLRVKVYDPALQVQVTMPAEDLKSILADYPVMIHRPISPAE